jgi:3-oxoacyl-[acyl-carrier protein] reductase
VKYKYISKIIFGFLLSLSFGLFGRGIKYSGLVLDKETNETLAFVNLISSDGHYGSTTDIDGKFKLVLPTEIDSIRVSYLGYETRYILTRNLKGPKTIFLKSREYDLAEYEVFPGPNPAHRIIRNVVNNRDLNNPQKLKSYAYTTYDKMVVTIDTSSLVSDTSLVLNDSLKGLAEFFKSKDLQNTENIKEELFDNFITNSIPLDCFVNNAATAYDDIITNIHSVDLENMFRVNVFSPLIITKYAIRNMIFNRIKGSIIHISSISVHTGYKGLAMYASSKGAIEAFSKNTAREWGVKGIRSNVVVPGFMETEMSATLTSEQKTRIYNRTSLKEATKVDSVAKTVHFLAGEGAISITGQNIHVDAGTI